MADRKIRIIVEGEDAGATNILRSVGKEANALTGTFNSFGASMQTVGKLAIGAVGAGIAAIGAGMVKTAVDGTKMAADLEAQMDVIASVLNKTEEEAQPLNDLILQLGINPNLKVSTLEAADAIETLATAGLSMSEILDGAAESTVLLSNASGGDFAQSAEIMTDAMSIFGDSITSYGDAVNGVIAVSNVSKFSVNDYALALAQAGGVAGTVGVEFDDFNTSIAAISPLFASGSDAGTSYKTMLMRLIPQSNAATDAMRDLGLYSGLTDKEFEKTEKTIAKYQAQLAKLDPTSKNYAERSAELTAKIAVLQSTLSEGSNAFYDAEGNLKSMAEVSAVLNQALSGLSEEQRSQALTTIFGSDAMRAAVGLAESGAVVYTDAATAARELGVSQEAVNAVMEGGITQFEALQLQMGQTDALEAAKQRVDNAKGAMEVFAGVIETVKISIGQGFLPILKDLANQFTEFVSAHSAEIIAFFRAFAEGVAYAASFIPGLLSGLFGMVGAFSGVISVIGQYIQTGELLSATEFGISEQTATVVDGMTGLIATVVDATGAIYTFVAPIVSAVAQFFTWQDVMVTLGVAVGSVVVPALISLAATLWPIVASVAAVMVASAALRTAWENDFLGMRTALTEFGSALSELTSGTDISTLKTNVTAAFADIGTAIRDYFSGDISLGGLASAVGQGFSDIGSALSTFFGGQDWSSFLGAIQWDQYISALSWENVLSTASLDWSDYISPLLWDAWVVVLDWASYITSLLTWDNFLTVLDWAGYIGQLLWDGYVSILSWEAKVLSLVWSDYVAPFLWDAWVTVVDWATYITPIAWNTLITTLSDWGQWITSLNWTDIITTAIDWATWIPALSWTAFINLLEWSVYIAGALAWGTYVVSLAWADWVTSLTWADVVAALDWTAYIVSFTWESFVEKLEWTGVIAKFESWGDFIAALDWTKIITTTVEWTAFIIALPWNTFVAALEWASWLVSLDWGSYVTSALSWSDWVASLDWAGFIGSVLAWTDFVAGLLWSSFVAQLDWPDVSFSWSSFVSKLAWPSITWPGWSSFIPSFPGWPDIGGMISNIIGGSSSGTNAIGTNYWGGGVSLVGETGPELVYVPQGSRILNSKDTRMALAGSGESVQVNVYATVANNLDINTLAYEIADVLRRRGR